MRTTRVFMKLMCRQCQASGTATWVRDWVLMTNRKVLLTVTDDFIKVGNEVYCGACLVRAEAQGEPEDCEAKEPLFEESIPSSPSNSEI